MQSFQLLVCSGKLSSCLSGLFMSTSFSRPRSGLGFPRWCRVLPARFGSGRRAQRWGCQLDLPLTRSMLPSPGSATCTDATRKCHRCTQNRAFSRRSVPRLVPRRRSRRGRLWKLAGLQAAPWNVTPWTYRVIVSEYTLSEVPPPRRRYEVTVTLPQPTEVEALLPRGGQAAVDTAAAAIAAEGC